MMPVTPPADEAAFVAQRDAVRGLLALASIEDVITRLQVGLHLVLLKRTPAKYGEHAVERLAHDLGLGSAALGSYVSVAETWSALEIHALTARTNALGDPLSWSHLVVLTRASSVAARRELTDRCLAGAWSVRELTVQVELCADAIQGSEENAALEDDAPGGLGTTDRSRSASLASARLCVSLKALEGCLERRGTDTLLLSRALESIDTLQRKVDAANAPLESDDVNRPSETRVTVRYRAGMPVKTRYG